MVPAKWDNLVNLTLAKIYLNALQKMLIDFEIRNLSFFHHIYQLKNQVKIKVLCSACIYVQLHLKIKSFSAAMNFQFSTRDKNSFSFLTRYSLYSSQLATHAMVTYLQTWKNCLKINSFTHKDAHSIHTRLKNKHTFDQCSILKKKK